METVFRLKSSCGFAESDPRLQKVKKIELIGGIVHIAPVGFGHGKTDSAAGGWLYYYAIHTPGCESGTNATWEMSGDRPQPDQHLRILPQYGGKSKVGKKYGLGAPELIVEVGDSSITANLREKKDIYYRETVDEYIVIDLQKKKVHWFVHSQPQYTNVAPGQGWCFSLACFSGSLVQFARILCESRSGYN